MISRSNRPGSTSTHTLWCFRLKSSGRAGYGIRWNHIIFMGPDWSGRHGLSTTKSCADHVRPATDRREENRRADEPGRHRREENRRADEPERHRREENRRADEPEMIGARRTEGPTSPGMIGARRTVPRRLPGSPKSPVS